MVKRNALLKYTFFVEGGRDVRTDLIYQPEEVLELYWLTPGLYISVKMLWGR